MNSVIEAQQDFWAVRKDPDRFWWDGYPPDDLFEFQLKEKIKPMGSIIITSRRFGRRNLHKYIDETNIDPNDLLTIARVLYGRPV